MICLICRQTEIVDGHISVKFARGEFQLTVTDVPARVCPSCGEAYVDENLAVRLLRDADEVSKTGILEDVIEYNSLV